MKQIFFLLFIPLFSLVADDAPQWKNKCDVFFAPDEELITNLVDLIDKEQKTIRIAVHNLTNRKVTKSLLAAKKRGAQIELNVDAVACKPKSPLNDLAKAGIPIFVYDPPPIEKNDAVELSHRHRAHMYNKFCLFEKNEGNEKLVWSGTFKFTYKSNKQNRENVIVASIEDLVSKYEKEFDSMKAHYCTAFKEFQKKKKKS